MQESTGRSTHGVEFPQFFHIVEADASLLSPRQAGGVGTRPFPQPAVHHRSTSAFHPPIVHEFQVATVSALAAGSLVAAVATWNRTGSERRFGAFLAICAAFLAFDKATGAVNHLHEGLHHLGVGDPPILRGIDDLVWLGAMLAALAFCAWHWRLLLRFPAVTLWLCAGAAFAATGLGIDSLGPEDGVAPHIEDWSELAMAASILAAALLFLRAAARARPAPPGERVRGRAPIARS